ncbi:phage tail protein [Hymenobacter armeniacus]|uniref:Phage tail protein n=1 Tax=Hymenobacter armeniacus TaxID=2771358 RepID=A0ABR8JQ16_9BACT|nr:tail fiber protein [Hymenobacter armeniacus]MBD2722085.1 phage tail protein [Hymenobacter armeniacus]
MDEYIGIVKLFAGNFAPQNWAFCNGQLMSIAQNSALFSILGTTYGGDGQTTFALPNLMGRVAVGAGNGGGLPPVMPGEIAGTASVTLTTGNLPAHNHQMQVSSGSATTNNPANNVLAVDNGVTSDESPVTVNTYREAADLVPASPNAIGMVGNSQPVSLMQPYLGMNYIICLNGLYPPRS